MKSRLIMLMALAVASLSILLTAGHFSYTTSSPPSHESLPPALASYLGVYEPGSPTTYQPVDAFAKAVGRQPNLVGYYSGWAEPFKTRFADTIQGHGATPFIQIDPTGASVSGLASGAYDDYLIAYAEAVRAFRAPIVIGFGHEMNAPWYSWGYGNGVSPETFVAAWQHLVTLFRQQGADNVIWVWTIQADGKGTGPIHDWWPGSQYVTWVGVDGFFYSPSDSFASVFGRTIEQVRTFTKKPVLLSETAVGPAANPYGNIIRLFRGMAAAKTLGLVWFDFPQDNGTYNQDWRIEDSSSAEIAFRYGVTQDLKPAPARN